MSFQSSSATLATTLFVATLACTGATARQIEPEALSRHVEILASDAYEGRAPGTSGERLTIEYIASEFEKAGLKPGGPAGPDGSPSWYQPVPIEEFTITGKPVISIRDRRGVHRLEQQGDIIIASRADTDAVAIRDAELMFVGYGVSAPSKGWDDFKGVDLRGKIAVVLINDPDFAADMNGLFDGPAMTYHGRWDYKLAELARQGALGTIIIHEERAALAPWKGMSHFFSLPQLDLQPGARDTKNSLIEGWMTDRLAERLFQTAGLDFAAEKAKAASPDFKPFALKGSRLSARFGLAHRKFLSHNVIGRLQGTDLGNEKVILSAHWDHLGIADADASGDRIYHGAQDNAVGVAGLIELARRFKSAPAPARSIEFVALTAEEKGLLGATYYTYRPVGNLADVVVNLNIDALDLKGPTRDISLWGDGKSSVEASVAEAAASVGRIFAINPRYASGNYFRADHFAFARAGVPAVTLGSGTDLIRGGPAAGTAAEQQYYDVVYHTPSDRWSPTLDFTGPAADLEIYARLTELFAAKGSRPTFLPASDYREAQDALRRRSGVSEDAKQGTD